jgi:hypothetical protein
MIRYKGDSSVAREEEELHKVMDVKTFHGCAEEEREASASEEGPSCTAATSLAALPPQAAELSPEASGTAAANPSDTAAHELRYYRRTPTALQPSLRASPTETHSGSVRIQLFRPLVVRNVYIEVHGTFPN